MREEERGGTHSSDEEEDGAGFASYGDFEAAGKRKSSVHLGGQRQSFRPGMVSCVFFPSCRGPAEIDETAPSIHSHPSGFSTRSTFDSTYPKPPASASTSKFPTTPASELVDAPILSRADWTPGEAMREKDARDAEKKREKRERVVGDVKAAGRGVGGWVRRNWKWLVPLVVFLGVA